VNRPVVSARARVRHDRAGDPLDGLVNLFDLGIVLAVAFLLAALSSVKLTEKVLSQNARTAPAGSVIKNPGQQAKPIQLKPGQQVVGRGRPIGTVYQLADGRTIIVRSDGVTTTTPAPATPATGTTAP